MSHEEDEDLIDGPSIDEIDEDEDELDLEDDDLDEDFDDEEEDDDDLEEEMKAKGFHIDEGGESEDLMGFGNEFNDNNY